MHTNFTDSDVEDSARRAWHALSMCWASTLVGWAWLMQFGRYAATVHHVRAVVMTPCGSPGFKSKLLEVTHDAAPAVTGLLTGLGIMLALSAWRSSRATLQRHPHALAHHIRVVGVALCVALVVDAVFTEILLRYYRSPWIEPLYAGPEYDEVIGPWGIDKPQWAAIILGACGAALSFFANTAGRLIRWSTALFGLMLAATAAPLQGIFNNGYNCMVEYGSYVKPWSGFAFVCLVGPTVAWRFLTVHFTRQLGRAEAAGT